MTTVSLVVALALGVSAPVSARPGPGLRGPAWIARKDLEFTPELRTAIDAVARVYRDKTRRRLEVTSGYRPAPRQAAAMYAKLAAGGSLSIYRNRRLVDPIIAAYREGRRKKWKRDKIIAAMTEVLSSQVARGEHISRHLEGRAFDVRSVGLSKGQRAALMAALAEVGGMRVIHESRPPHYHIEIVRRARTKDSGDAGDAAGEGAEVRGEKPPGDTSPEADKARTTDDPEDAPTPD